MLAWSVGPTAGRWWNEGERKEGKMCQVAEALESISAAGPHAEASPFRTKFPLGRSRRVSLRFKY